jgi:hypothetical protein
MMMVMCLLTEKNQKDSKSSFCAGVPHLVARFELTRTGIILLVDSNEK